MDHAATTKRLEEIEHALWGNAKPGLLRDVDKIKSDLYADPTTGSKGLVKNVDEIRTMVSELRGGVAFGKAVVAIAGGLLVLIQVADKLGFFAQFGAGQ